MSPDAARAKVEHDVALLLPDGLATPDVWLWAVEAEDRPVGWVFLGRRGDDLWLYDITIDAGERGLAQLGDRRLLTVPGLDLGAEALELRSGAGKGVTATDQMERMVGLGHLSRRAG